MPQSNLLKPFGIILLGAFLGFYSVKQYDQSKDFQQDLASSAFSKLDSEQFSKDFLEIRLVNKELAPHNDQISTLVASVKAIKEFKNPFTYHWNLPDNVTLLEGTQSALISQINKDQTLEYQIKVKGYSKEVKNYISFSINGNILNRSISRDILISSNPEDSYEYLSEEARKPAFEKPAKMTNLKSKK